jgi:high-affinity Fe2+/Pb2+ permease
MCACTDERSELDLGAKFWLGVLGIAIAGAFGFLLIIGVISWAWWHFGLLGGLLFICVILLLIGWISDRRTRKRYPAPELEA